MFAIDAINGKDDSKAVKSIVERLDFSAIVPKLIIKPIINPFAINKDVVVDNEIILKLKQWDAVRESVRGAVDSAVRDSVGGAVWYSVWYAVWYAVDSAVRTSMWAYMSSFFNLEHDEWKHCNFEFEGNPYQSAIDLWEMGIVPSFDGKTWRLHAGKEADIIYSISKDELMNYTENGVVSWKE